MPVDKIFNDNQTFLNTANSYVARGWSVIPVWGASQPAQFKVAAVRWSPFTDYHATEDVLHHWFVWAEHQGIAIITGRISGLAVLDFDCDTQYQNFLKQHPHLTQTYTVKTPRGIHLYFAIPDTCTTKSMKGQGIDWQWEGRYVVAPPTQGYALQNSLNPRLLSQGDICGIENFINASKPVLTRYEPLEKNITQRELQSLYNKQAIHGQRNDVLFNSALTARDNGWSQSETMQVLGNAHAHNRHNDELLSYRHREAQRTIASAFSRPARQRTVLPTALANTIRESLMQAGLTAAIRVIEALRQVDLPNGAYFSRQEAILVLQGIVGEHSVIKALTAMLDGTIPLFNSIEAHLPPLENPHSPNGLASNSCQRHISKCLEITSPKPHFSEFGRKTIWYQLPTNADLAYKLGLELSRIADDLDLEALSSAKRTRKALHRGYIARRPGAYPNRWLARRLGVSISTKNRYDREIPDLHKRATYTAIPIYWQNIEEIPTMDVPGCFLQDESGKRYPAQQAIARYLLSQKHQLRLMKQGVNYYWVGNRFDVSQTQVTAVRDVPAPWLEKAAQYRAHSTPETYSAKQPQTPQIEPVCTKRKLHSAKDTLTASNSDTAQSELAGHVPYRPFRDEHLETLAVQVQERINQLACTENSRLSLTSSRRLIIGYGVASVLKTLKWLEQRQGVDNPAGLLTVILRSDAKQAELTALMQRLG